ncbi:hypothetical protein CAPTEDRAFT_191207 [Capitella teleta]|uniref:Reverse transcriptase domain-containing protein n=1 Tax=Capitella teleta TaxID=283909 RepID=R7TF19_CAPTE|nr:hypothetical protein CAPTEDRAFT_191207 [Capitella teleta]|eukprot:ELT92329.1 hypothetical protein CAPTEDRAFT_191207 [Capitella teleta]
MYLLTTLLVSLVLTKPCALTEIHVGVVLISSPDNPHSYERIAAAVDIAVEKINDDIFPPIGHHMVTSVGTFGPTCNPNSASGVHRPPGTTPVEVYINHFQALSHPLHKTYMGMIQLGQWPRLWKHCCDPDIQKKKKKKKKGLALYVIEKAAHSIEQRKAFFLLQTDIAGAFDRDQLKKCIEESGVPSRLLRLLSDYLRNCTLNVRVSENHPLDIGVIQGSGLGHTTYGLGHTTYGLGHTTYGLGHTTYGLGHRTYGLGPVNVYFVTIFDATEDLDIGFADDLNIISNDETELN